jgi:hypothetical protein
LETMNQMPRGIFWSSNTGVFGAVTEVSIMGTPDGAGRT